MPLHDDNVVGPAAQPVSLVDANEAPEGYVAFKMPEDISKWCKECAFKKYSKCVLQKCEPHNRADGQNVFFMRPVEKASSANTNIYTLTVQIKAENMDAASRAAGDMLKNVPVGTEYTIKLQGIDNEAK
jgi:hypothetical protein